MRTVWGCGGGGRRPSGAGFERTRRERFQRLVFPVREEKLDWGQCRMKTRIFAYLFDRSVSVFNERNNSTYRLMTTQAGDGRVAGAGERGRGLPRVWRGPLPGAPSSVEHRSEGAGRADAPCRSRSARCVPCSGKRSDSQPGARVTGGAGEWRRRAQGEVPFRSVGQGVERRLGRGTTGDAPGAN